jgi:hypothetical protein
MATKMIAQTTGKMMKAKMRTDFIEQGGYDGRFRPKVVCNKKGYNRKGRGSKAYLRGLD